MTCNECHDLKAMAASWAMEVSPDTATNDDVEMKAAEVIARGLMEDDLANLKAGYSLHNAAIAACEYVYGRSFSFNNPQLTALTEILNQQPDEATRTAVFHLRHEDCVHTVERI